MRPAKSPVDEFDAAALDVLLQARGEVSGVAGDGADFGERFAVSLCRVENMHGLEPHHGLRVFALLVLLSLLKHHWSDDDDALLSGLTQRPNVFQVLKPATWVASGF